MVPVMPICLREPLCPAGSPKPLSITIACFGGTCAPKAQASTDCLDYECRPGQLDTGNDTCNEIGGSLLACSGRGGCEIPRMCAWGGEFTGWDQMSEFPSTFDLEGLVKCARGELFGKGNAQLPMPPMLMFDRITEISATKGKNGKGHVVAELDIRPGLWFFDCHFVGDPVMPGCLGLDALWQLTGFNLAWRGLKGKGRALGVGEVKFADMVTPNVSMLTYIVDFTRVIERKLKLGIADGRMLADGREIYSSIGLKVGLFT